MLDAGPLRAPQLPVERLVLGRPVKDVAALLPRLFNLCRGAQAQAVRLALGLTQDVAAVADEIERDHLMRFFLIWPRHFDGTVPILKTGLPEGADACARLAFGPAGRMPETRDDFDAFLQSDHGIAPILSAIDRVFPAHTAVAKVLPPLDPKLRLDPKAALENSVAARNMDHPVMRSLAQTHGPGPLWRAAGRAYDLDAALGRRLPEAICPIPGEAHVPAARGLYAVRAAHSDGRVTAFKRVTPTDHLTAPGGILDQTLATLEASQIDWLPLLMDILDPCTPIDLGGGNA